ncbi:MAG: zinc-binding dehydrogenase [Caldilineaceae bacterium]
MWPSSAGPIGLFVLQLAKLSGAEPIYISDKFDWRLELAASYGAIPVNCDKTDPVAFVREATGGRGVDVAIEAAWADHSVQQAAEMALGRAAGAGGDSGTGQDGDEGVDGAAQGA